jgi:hypothetical protein
MEKSMPNTSQRLRTSRSSASSHDVADLHLAQIDHEGAGNERALQPVVDGLEHGSSCSKRQLALDGDDSIASCGS